MSGSGSSIGRALRAIGRITGTRACALAVAGVVFVAAAAQQLATLDFEGEVAFDTDQVHHQFLAVNLLEGQGYQVGPAVDFDRYRIARPPVHHDYYKRFIRPDFHRYTFGRTPGYPLFLVAVYSICGIEPACARTAQALLNALAAALLVLLGAHLWSRRGGLAGVIAAAAWIGWYRPDPTVLMSESLATIGLLGVTGAYLLYWRRPTAPRSLLLGVIVAGSLLIRPNVVFLPLIFCAVMLLRERPLGRAGLHCLALIAGVLLPILPWSAYATIRSEEPGRHGDGAGTVLLSTQPSRTLLDGNNEACFEDGRWHPEWRTRRAGDERFFYNRVADDRRSTASLLIAFWWTNLGCMPGLVVRKIGAALDLPKDAGALLAMLAFYLALGIATAIGGRSNRPQRAGAFLPLVMWINLLATVAILFGEPRFVQPFALFALLPAAYFPLYMVGLVGTILRYDP
jgi:4-amino-4-deoxy-L-arabinose transferase-like glycosyltransferase